MKIEFDPRDRDSCTSVLAVIAALQPEMVGSEAPTPAPTPPVDDSDAEPDAATAFGGGNDSNGATAPAPPTAPATAGESTDSTSGNASPSSDVELDANGLPWDARIHSGPADRKPKNADGTWRAKRGVGDNPEFVKQVEAELRQVMGAPAPTPAAAEAPAPASPPPPPAAEAPTPAPPAPPSTPVAAATASGPAAATPAPDAPPAPPTPPTPPAGDAPAKTFAELMKKITARQTAGTLTIADTKAVAEALGLSGVADLMKRPDLIEAFEQALPAGDA